ncbi:hypothetical protein D3C76_1271280 [compost metagenome]
MLVRHGVCGGPGTRATVSRKHRLEPLTDLPKTSTRVLLVPGPDEVRRYVARLTSTGVCARLSRTLPDRLNRLVSMVPAGPWIRRKLVLLGLPVTASVRFGSPT